MTNYAILAARSSTVIGDGEGGFDVMSLFTAAGRGAQSLIQAKKDADAAEVSAKEASDALAASVAADKFAKEALAKSFVSAVNESTSKVPDKIAADMAVLAAVEAGSKLSAEGKKKRAEAARAAVQSAVQEWQIASAGKNAQAIKVKAAWVQAAQQVFAMTQDAPPVTDKPRADAVPSPVASESFFSRKVIGPIPGWGLVAGVGAIATAAVFVLRGRA